MALEGNFILRILHEGGRQAGAAISGINPGALNPLESIPDRATGTGSAHLNRLRAQAISKRSAQTGALGGLASQAPMAKTMMGVGKAFAAGGAIAGVATGVTAILGIGKQLLGMSKIFGTMSKTFFQMTSMMIDMAIMPMIPYLMKFLNWWMINGTRIANNVGQWLARNGPAIASFFVAIGKIIGTLIKILPYAAAGAVGFMAGGPIGAVVAMGGVAIAKNTGNGKKKMASGGIVTRPTEALIGEAGPEAVIPLTGGSGGGALEGLFSTISGGMGATANIFSTYQKKAGAVIDKIKTSVQRNMEQWYFDMLGGSVVPETVESVESIYNGMLSAAEENKEKTDEKSGGWLSTITTFFSDFWGGMVTAWNKAKDWAGKVFGWLNPFDSDDEEIEDPEGIDKTSGTTWWKNWLKGAGQLINKAKEWLKDKACEALSDMAGKVPGGDKILSALGIKCDTSSAPEPSISEVTGLDPGLNPLHRANIPHIATAEEKKKLKSEYLRESGFDSLSDFYASVPEAGGGDSRGGMDKTHPDFPFSKGIIEKTKEKAKAVVEVLKVPFVAAYNEFEEMGMGGWISGAKDKGSSLLNTISFGKFGSSQWERDVNSGDERRGMDKTFDQGAGIVAETKAAVNKYVIQPLSNAWDSGTEAAGDAWTGTTDWSSSKWNSIKNSDVVQSVKNSRVGKTISSGASKVGGWFGWGEKQMGGVIPGPLGSLQPTIMHGGEVVLPAHLGANWASATAGTMIASGGPSMDGAMGGGVFAPTFNRPMNIQIFTTENAAQLLSRLDRMASLEDAAFFSSV